VRACFACFAAWGLRCHCLGSGRGVQTTTGRTGVYAKVKGSLQQQQQQQGGGAAAAAAGSSQKQGGSATPRRLHMTPPHPLPLNRPPHPTPTNPHTQAASTPSSSPPWSLWPPSSPAPSPPPPSCCTSSSSTSLPRAPSTTTVRCAVRRLWGPGVCVALGVGGCYRKARIWRQREQHQQQEQEQQEQQEQHATQTKPTSTFLSPTPIFFQSIYRTD